MSQPTPTVVRLARPAVILLFLLSGASALMFETLWARMLTITFGATTFAVSTVLTVFMGGLALGGYLAGRVADRLQHEASALRLYGIFELVVAVYGLLFPIILGGLHVLHAWIWARWSPATYSFALIRFVIVASVLIVPTTAMGATLPILARFYARREAGLGRDVGTLYAVNIFGAVTGTFLAGFVLMPAWGVSATNLTACCVNLVLGTSAVVLAGILLRSSSSDVAVPVQVEPPDSPRQWPLMTWVVLVAVGVSGFSAMVYQQAWTRVLALIIGSSVYAFALILIAFLLGLALGSAVYARRTAHLPGQAGNLVVIHVIIALAALAGYAYMDRLPALFLVLSRSGTVTPNKIFALKFLISALVVVIPTFFMGMIFPATIAICAETMSGVGRTVGRVYAVNTLGSIVGSFVGGFLLIPSVGVQSTIGLMIWVNLLIAAAVTGVATLSRVARVGRGVAIGLVLAVLVSGTVGRWQPARITSGVFRLSIFQRRDSTEQCPRPDSPVARVFHKGPGRDFYRNARALLGPRPELETYCDTVAGRRLIYFREGITATISTWQTIVEGFESSICWEILSLQVNGKADASVTGAFRRERNRRCGDYLGHPERIRPLRVSPRHDTETQVLSGVLPVLLHPSPDPPGRALIIGWGSGLTVGSMAVCGVAHIDAIELEREVLRAARPFERYNHAAASHPRVRIYEADGRNFLTAAQRRYDIIVSEPSNPWMTGASSLFTREFFRLVRSRMRRDGVFVQWLQLYEISVKNVLILLATLRSVFPYVTVVRPRLAEVDLLLVATRNPLRLNRQIVQQKMSRPTIRAELLRIRFESIADLLARFLILPERLTKITRGYPRNTDDNALIEFSAPRDLINYRLHAPHKILKRLAPTAPPAERLLGAAHAGLGVALADAHLKLGDVKNGLLVLDRLGGPENRVSRRRHLIERLARKPEPGRLFERLAQSHPEHEALRQAATAKSAGERVRRVVQILRRSTPRRQAYRLLGALLSRTRHHGLALLFLLASQHLAPEKDTDLRWLTSQLLRSLSLDELAFRNSLKIAR